jgi:hypothetical protein
MRLVEILPFAGFAAVARVSWAKALFLGGWLAAFVIVKGTSPRASVQDGTFFRLLMPGWPAFLVLVAALPLLFPGAAHEVKARLRLPAPIPLRSRPVLASCALVGLVPLLVLAALPTLKDRSIVSEYTNNVIVPVDPQFHLRAREVGGRVELTWRRPPGARRSVFYRIYLSRTAGQPPIGGLVDYRDGIACLPRGRGAAACRLLMNPVGVAERPAFGQQEAGTGLVYRVGLMANWLDDPNRGDVLLVSEPVRIGAAG